MFLIFEMYSNSNYHEAGQSLTNWISLVNFTILQPQALRNRKHQHPAVYPRCQPASRVQLLQITRNSSSHLSHSDLFPVHEKGTGLWMSLISLLLEDFKLNCLGRKTNHPSEGDSGATCMLRSRAAWDHSKVSSLQIARWVEAHCLVRTRLK